jgi:predicted HicB family RNase H-like nuclease
MRVSRRNHVVSTARARASGRFVVRIEPALHPALREANALFRRELGELPEALQEEVRQALREFFDL